MKNTNSSRRTFLKSVGVTGAMGLAGCSSTNRITGNVVSETGTTVQFWTLFSGGDGAAMKSIVDRFNTQQPIGDVQINRQRIPWDDYYTKIYTALAADKGPDIAIMHQALIPRFQASLQPYNPYLSDSAKSRYVETLWRRNRINGQQLALPLDAHPVGLYYNRSLFKEAGLDPDSPPTNFQEFKETCNTITNNTNAHAFSPDPYFDGVGILRSFVAFNSQRGGTMFTDSGTNVNFTNNAGLGAAQFLYNITGKYQWDIPNTSGNRTDVAFQDGNLAMVMNGTWYAPLLQSLDGFDWSMFKPFIAPGKQRNRTEAGSHTIVLPKNSSQDEQSTRAAVQVAEWITQENPEWGTVAGHLPASRTALNSQALQESPLWPKSLSKYRQMASKDQFTYLPRTPFNVNEGTTWGFLLDIYSHNVTPKQGIRRGAKNIRGLIDDVN